MYDIIWGLAIIKYNKQKNIFRVLNFVPKEPNSVKISSFIGRILCAIIGWIGLKMVGFLKPNRINKYCKNKLKIWFLL